MTGRLERLGLTLGVLACAAGCTLPVGVLKGKLAQETVTAARSTTLGVTTLSGAVLGPRPGLIADNAASVLSNNAGGLIANNGGGLISNNGGGVVSDHAGSYRVRHVADLTVPAAGATLTVVDAQGRQLSTKPAQTDKDGRYKLTGLKPAGGVVFVRATYQLEGHEVTLLAPVLATSGATQTVAVDPATTLVAHQLAGRLKQGAERPESVRQAALDEASRAIAGVMSPRAVTAAAILPADKATETYEAMLAESPVLAAAIGEARAADPSPTARPTATPTAEATSRPTGQATAAPTAAPTTAPAPTAAPRTLVGKVSTYAGGQAGAADGPRASATFRGPEGLAFGPKGVLYVADAANHLIRVIETDGTVRTLAGSGASGKRDAADARNATFNHPMGIAVDKAGNLFVADRDNHCIRKIAPDGVVSTFAGSGAIDLVDGVGTEAAFNEPTALAFDKAGNLFVCDSHNHCIRKITPDGKVSLFAGNGDAGGADGAGTEARFRHPTGFCIDDAGYFYTVEEESGRVRKIAPDGRVTTLDSGYATPGGVAVNAAGTIYVTEMGDSHVHVVAPGAAEPVFWGADWGFADGTGRDAKFKSPMGMAIDGEGRLYVADTENHRIRLVE